MAILTLTNDDAGVIVPIGGAATWRIFGTDGIDTLEVAAGTSVSFGGQAGVDVVKLMAASTDYTVTLSGSSALFIHTATGKTVSMPVTSEGDTVQFTNGPPLTLKGGAAGVLLGTQVISGASNAAVSGFGSTTTSPGALTLLAQAAAFSVQNNGMDALLPPSDVSVQALTSGRKWANTNITYNFSTSVPADYSGVSSENTTSGNLSSNWSALNQTENSVARQAFVNVSSFTSLRFFEVAGTGGDIRFNVVSMVDPIVGFAYYPGSGLGGDVFLDSRNRTPSAYTAGSEAYMTVFHELGHALGLKHPFEPPKVLSTADDNYTNTIMSYTPGRTLLLNFGYSDGRLTAQPSYGAVPASFSLIDVASLQAVYGANTAYNTGNNVYTLSYDQHTYLTIWDTGGNDTLSAANATGNSTIDLRPGYDSSLDVRTIAQLQAASQAYYRSIGVSGADTFVASVYANPARASSLYTGENNVAIAHGVWIENAITGNGHDMVRDNKLNNTIITGSGDDLVQLFDGGFDLVDGGAGRDTVQFNNTQNQFKTEKQADGSYLIVGTYFAAKLIGIENLQYLDGTMALA